MRDVKTRAAMEQPKTRQQNAIPRTAVRILQRHYAQQKQERQTQHQRQPVEYATEQVKQSAVDAARLTFRATQQLQRKYVLHKYRAQKVRQRQETTAAQVRQRDMWQSTEQSAAAQHTATVPRQPAQKPPAPTMTAAQQRAKQHAQRDTQRQMLQQTKAAARKAGQRLEQMAQAAGKAIRTGIEAIAAAGGGVVLFLLLALPVIAVAAALSPAGAPTPPWLRRWAPWCGCPREHQPVTAPPLPPPPAAPAAGTAPHRRPLRLSPQYRRGWSCLPPAPSAPAAVPLCGRRLSSAGASAAGRRAGRAASPAAGRRS